MDRRRADDARDRSAECGHVSDFEAKRGVDINKSKVERTAHEGRKSKGDLTRERKLSEGLDNAVGLGEFVCACPMHKQRRDSESPRSGLV